MGGSYKPIAPIIIDRWVTGYITKRNALISPYRSIGINVIKFNDALLSGINVELTDDSTLARRPPFNKFCTQALQSTETAIQFSSVRNLSGEVTTLLDTNLALQIMTPTSLSNLITKTVPDQMFVQQVGNTTYLTDGTDISKWNGTAVTTWGITAPTTPPTLQQLVRNPGFWIKSTNYLAGQALLDINGNIEFCVQGGKSAPTIPVWPTVAGGSVTDGSVIWQMVGALGVWFPSTDYTTPSVILDSNNNIQLATVSGTTGTTAPSWSTSFGGTTTDGGVTWDNIGPGIAIAYSGYNWGYAWRTVDGNLSTLSPLSAGSGPILGSVPISPISITQYSIASGIATFTAPNKLEAQQQVVINGFPVSSFLNGQPSTVFSSSGTAFTCSINGPDTATTAEAGTAHPVITTINGKQTTNPSCNSVATVTSVNVTGDILTVQCANNFSGGITVQFSGLTNATFLNGQQVDVVFADDTEFQANFVHDDYANTPDGGTATFLAVEIYRNPDGGGLYLFSGAVENPQNLGVTNFTQGGIAGQGTDNGVPGIIAWTNPNNVTSGSSFATVALTPPAASGGSLFTNVQLWRFQPVAKGTANATVTLTSPGNVTAGNTVILSFDAFDWTAGSSSVSVTDNLGNTWVQDFHWNQAGQEHDLFFYHAQITHGGAPMTISITPLSTIHSNAFIIAAAGEFTGFIVPVAKDGTAGNGAVSLNNQFATGGFTTTHANDVIFSAVYNNNGGLFTPSTAIGWVFADGGNVGNIFGATAAPAAFGMAYRPVNAVTAVNPTWFSANGNFNGQGMTVAYKLNTYAPSNGLFADIFPITVPSSGTIQGITIQLDAKYDGAAGQGVITAQLVKNGTPVGTAKNIFPTGTSTTYTLGSTSDLWGTTWSPSDANNPVTGVLITANLFNQSGGPFTFSVKNVQDFVNGQTGIFAWSFFDIDADTDLDFETIAPQNHLNDPPPGSVGSLIQDKGTILAWWQDRIWMAVGGKLYFSGGPDILNGDPEQCWPPANVLSAGGQITGLAPTTQGLVVWTTDTLKVVLGGPQTITFYIQPVFENFGISSPNCLRQDGDTLYVYTTSKQFFTLSGNRDQTGERVGNYFTANNYLPAASSIAMHRDGADAGVFISNGETQLARYGLNTGNWSINYQRLLPPQPFVQTFNFLAGPIGTEAEFQLDSQPLVLGNTLVIGVLLDQTGTTPSLADDLGNTYTLLSSQSLLSNSRNLSIFAAPITNAGDPTILVTFDPSFGFTTNVLFVGFEVDASGSVILTSPTANSGQSATWESNAITTSSPNSVLASFVYSDPSFTPTPTDNFEINAQQLADFNTQSLTLASAVLDEPGTSTSSWSSTSNTNWATVLIAYPLAAAPTNTSNAGPINSVETAPGVYSMLLGSTLPGDFVYKRDFDATVFSDNGVPYPANVIVGNITASQPGAPLQPLYDIIGYFGRPTGASVPKVNVLFNEIFPSGLAQFVNLPVAHNEAPIGMEPSLSIFAKRWPVNQNQVRKPMNIRQGQVQIDFGDETVKSEMIVLGMKFDNEDA